MEPEKRIKDRAHTRPMRLWRQLTPTGLTPLFVRPLTAPNLQPGHSSACVQRLIPKSMGLHMSDQTVPDALTDSGGREGTRFLIFGFSSVCVIAEIAWLTALAWATLSLARWLFF